MHSCENQRRLLVCRRTPAFVTFTTHEIRPFLKHEYIRKIATDACLVGCMPHPNSNRIPSGLLRDTESVPCTYTTNSGNSGMKIYPYSEYILCDCTLNLRRPRGKSLCNKCMSIPNGIPLHKHNVHKPSYSQLGQCLVMCDSSRASLDNCCSQHRLFPMRHYDLPPFSPVIGPKGHSVANTSTLLTSRQSGVCVGKRAVNTNHLQDMRILIPELTEASINARHSYPAAHHISNILPKSDPHLSQKTSLDDVCLSMHGYKQTTSEHSIKLHKFLTQRRSLSTLDPSGFEAYANLLKEVHIQ